jgi:hypothetical protein
MEQGSEDLGTNGQGAATTDVDDDYLRWQEEIRLAEEEAEAMKAGKSHRYHKDFRKQVEFAEEPAVAAIEEAEDDGTVYRWDQSRNAWIPQASSEYPLRIAFWFSCTTRYFLRNAYRYSLYEALPKESQGEFADL